MNYINRVFKAKDYSGDELLYVDQDNQGNPVNLGQWDFRPMKSNRPVEKTPYLLLGRVIDWDTDDNVGIARPRKTSQPTIEKQDGALILSSTTTGGQQNGTLLVDGFTNFVQEDISHNQWVGLFEDGTEQNHSFVQRIIAPHKVRLQDELFFDTSGGQRYKVYHSIVHREFNETGQATLRWAMHTESIAKATLAGKAMHRYFRTLEADSDLIDVELEEREAGKVPAWVYVADVGRVVDASVTLSEEEINKGVEQRREIEVTLQAAETLHRFDPASEINFQININS